jgi:hypothetical protein
MSDADTQNPIPSKKIILFEIKIKKLIFLTESSRFQSLRDRFHLALRFQRRHLHALLLAFLLCHPPAHLFTAQ